MAIIFCGLPLTGKSTTAEAISQKLGIRHIDIDANIRFPLFGQAPENANRDPQAGEEMRAQMLFSYETLCRSICFILSRERHVIATATFSKRKYWDILLASFRKYLTAEQFANSELKVFLCEVMAIDEREEREEIEKRIATRLAEGTYFGGCKDIEHYFVDKTHFESPSGMPYLNLNTFPPNTIEHCTEIALKYVTEET